MESLFVCAKMQTRPSKREMGANVPENERNKKQINDNYQYFDERLYGKRTVIERVNAWMDSCKALTTRYVMKQKRAIG